jgi:hypothetical protein
MAKRKQDLYVNKFTGDIWRGTKKKARELGEDWTRIEFVDNEDGVPVMRMQLAGATVDVSENGQQEIEVQNGNAEAE